MCDAFSPAFINRNSSHAKVVATLQILSCVYTMQPVVQPAVQPAASCIRGFTQPSVSVDCSCSVMSTGSSLPSWPYFRCFDVWN